jgi:hypothetical protein
VAEGIVRRLANIVRATDDFVSDDCDRADRHLFFLESLARFGERLAHPVFICVRWFHRFQFLMQFVAKRQLNWIVPLQIVKKKLQFAHLFLIIARHATPISLSFRSQRR